jgi:aryl-alcohol dehydrogenase-like predicted oxidoreductase
MTASQHAPARLTRRRLLQYTAAAGATALLPWPGAWAKMTPAKAKQAMRRRKIPSTGEALPVMGLGSSGSFSAYGGGDRAALRTVMRRFVAMGGTLVDTSPTYGDAEILIGQISQAVGVRNKLFMATKVDTYGRRSGREQMAASRQKLGPPIDLMQVHNLVDVDTQWATLKQMKAARALRYIGITHYLTSAFDELERQMRAKDMDFVQFNYSIMTPDAEKRLLPLAADRGIAVIVNRAFNDGDFFSQVEGQKLPAYAQEFDCFSWGQFALKYVLANKAVNAVIPATSDPKHLEDNMHAGYGRLPDAALRRRMRATIAAL